MLAGSPEAIAETLRFSARIGFSLDQLKYNYPSEPVPPGKTPQQHLEELTWTGATRRYPSGVPENGRTSTVFIAHELGPCAFPLEV